jgi:hypothetical protein
MAPGIALIVTFVDAVSAAILDPGAITYLTLVAVAAIFAVAAAAVWRRFGTRAMQS